MQTLTINISIDVDVHYFERLTHLTDEQISQRVYEHVDCERSALATEARICALKLLEGQNCGDD